MGLLQRAFDLVTPAYLTRSFRSLLTHDSCRTLSSPELLPFLDGMAALGSSDFLGVNGLDPEGLGVILGFWVPERVSPPRREMAIYRRMAHHLGAAHRCRRRLHELQAERLQVDPTEGAEAILDAHKRVVHAVGAAKEKDAQAELIETSAARDLARRTKRHAGGAFVADASSGLRHWRPLTSARWTLVDSFERGGARYVVARENQSRVHGLAHLTDRERQVIAYLAVGQSTKEAAYALGISDGTVRVLAARAAARLGVRSRRELLDHADVRGLRPDCQVPAGAHRLHNEAPRR
jgi:DNA-binding CsgD family transcriptional regulator